MRAEFRRRVSGLGLRSATFDCDRLDEALRPGRRIHVGTPRILWDRYGEEYSTDAVAVPATITSSHRGEFVCVIDKGYVSGGPDGEVKDQWRFRKKMRAARIIRFLDEPLREICKLGRAKTDGVCDVPDDEECFCEHAFEIDFAP